VRQRVDTKKSQKKTQRPAEKHREKRRREPFVGASLAKMRAGKERNGANSVKKRMKGEGGRETTTADILKLKRHRVCTVLGVPFR